MLKLKKPLPVGIVRIYSSPYTHAVGCRIIAYVLNGAVPSNVKRMSLIFKISKINLEYVAIFLTKIPQLFFIQIKRLFPVLHSVMIIYLTSRKHVFYTEIHLFC
jgi:hypothetical protein